MASIFSPLLRLLLLTPFLAFVLVSGAPPSRSFTIANDTFLKDGKPFTLRSGSLHYFRVPQAYWRDRMERMQAMGLNSVTAYIAWNWHEQEEGTVT
jgi:hypothetical protein